MRPGTGMRTGTTPHTIIQSMIILTTIIHLATTGTPTAGGTGSVT